MTKASPSVIRDDFDRIALLADEGWDHNSHYHDFLLRQLPERFRAALDAGGGTGTTWPRSPSPLSGVGTPPATTTTSSCGNSPSVSGGHWMSDAGPGAS